MNNIRFELRDDHIGILTVDRPESLNALNIQTFKELNVWMDRMNENRDLLALVITGQGRSFVAGADLSECKDAGIEENRAYARLAQDTFTRIEKLPFPVIAAVNGFALGGGCELSLVCDVIIAGEKAKFGMPEVSLGVIPCFGGTHRLPKRVGLSKAKELIYTGKMVKAAEAKEIGLADYVVSQETLLDEAVSMAREMTKHSPAAVGYAKEVLNQTLELDLVNALELERNLSGICYGLPDKEEGMKAFSEKREPEFPSRTCAE
ncbi:MAG: enoyl-CoA hydratase/isomerase family protein [Eubacterium sp.]|nr:enoyl-CoA hydratase/isomerase family protein [Eubacterium sp.]